MMRAVRIVGVTTGLAWLFHLSQRAGEVRGNPPVPGMEWAIGILAALFLVRAIVTERTRGPEDNWQKDLLWGVAAGGFLTLALRLWWR
jgi:hypothetical protein